MGKKVAFNIDIQPKLLQFSLFPCLSSSFEFPDLIKNCFNLMSFSLKLRRVSWGSNLNIYQFSRSRWELSFYLVYNAKCLHMNIIFIRIFIFMNVKKVWMLWCELLFAWWNMFEYISYFCLHFAHSVNNTSFFVSSHNEKMNKKDG